MGHSVSTIPCVLFGGGTLVQVIAGRLYLLLVLVVCLGPKFRNRAQGLGSLRSKPRNGLGRRLDLRCRLRLRLLLIDRLCRLGLDESGLLRLLCAGSRGESARAMSKCF